MRSIPAIGALVLLGSAVPFLPTGELVSGSAALTGSARLPLVALFCVSWAGSVLGDVALLLEARLGRRWINPWIDRRAFAAKVRHAQDGLERNVFRAVVTGRLVPGGRAPVILALGLSRSSLRRFFAADVIACGAWALLYSCLGAVGGSIAENPLWGLALAVGAALAISLSIPLVQRLRPRTRQQTADQAHGSFGATASAHPEAVDHALVGR